MKVKRKGCHIRASERERKQGGRLAAGAQVAGGDEGAVLRVVDNGGVVLVGVDDAGDEGDLQGKAAAYEETYGIIGMHACTKLLKSTIFATLPLSLPFLTLLCVLCTPLSLSPSPSIPQYIFVQLTPAVQ